jgi:hypothetical protein
LRDEAISYFGAVENQIASSHKTRLAMTIDIDEQASVCKPISARFSSHALPGGKWNKRRGSTDKNVGRV